MKNGKRIYSRRKHLIILSLAAAIVIFILISCLSRPSSIDTEMELESNDLIVGSSEGNAFSLYSMSINKTGVFYDVFYQLRYRDYETNEEYVLCDKANCLHPLSSSCNAYLANMFGIGYYDGQIYAVYNNRSNNTFDFIKMDVNCQNQKVIASFERGEYEAGEWYLASEPEYVYYGYGKMFVILEYKYVEDEEIWDTVLEEDETTYVSTNGLSRLDAVMVDLTSGESTVLFETDERADLYQSLKFQLISEDKVILIWREDEDALIGSSLMLAIRNGELDDLEDVLEEIPEENGESGWYDENKVNALTNFYMDCAVFTETEQTLHILQYDLASGQLSELYEQACTPYYDENGIAYSFNSTMFCMGWTEDGFLVARYDYSGKADPHHMTFLEWSFETESFTELLEIEDGGVPSIKIGDVGNYILDGGKVLYMEYLEDGETGQMYYYDLDAGESATLFVDDKYITFRIQGETEDSFVGDMVVNDVHGFYVIPKEDFYQGNFSEATFLFDDDQFDSF